MKNVAGPRAGTFAAVKKGVLKAVEHVVENVRSGRAGTDVATPFGPPQSFFSKQAPEAGSSSCAFWTKQMENVQKTTNDKKRMAPVRRIVPRLGQPLAPALPKRWSSICFIPKRPGNEAALGACIVQTGTHRCSTSALVILDNLSDLLDCAEPFLLVHAIYIVGLGLTVAMASSLATASDDPSKLLEKSLLRHKPLNHTKTVFQCSQAFRDRNPNILKALQCCSNAPNSVWSVEVGEAAVGANAGPNALAAKGKKAVLPAKSAVKQPLVLSKLARGRSEVKQPLAHTVRLESWEALASWLLEGRRVITTVKTPLVRTMRTPLSTLRV